MMMVMYSLHVISRCVSPWRHRQPPIRPTQIIQTQRRVVIRIALARLGPAFDKALLFALTAGTFFRGLIFTAAGRLGVDEFCERRPYEVQALLPNAQHKSTSLNATGKACSSSPPSSSKTDLRNSRHAAVTALWRRVI